MNSQRHHAFTEEINKIGLNSNDEKRMRSIASIKTYTYGTKKDVICKNEKIKRNVITKQYKNV